MTAAELEKMLAEVTPGEWEACPGHEQKNGQRYWQIQNEYDAIMQNQFCWAQGSHDANARLIAMAPTLARKVIAAERLAEALHNMMKEAIRLAESGDAGFWDPEEVQSMIESRAAIAAWEATQ